MVWSFSSTGSLVRDWRLLSCWPIACSFPKKPFPAASGVNSSSFAHSCLPEAMSYINNDAAIVPVPWRAPMINNLPEFARTCRLRTPICSFFESNKTFPSTTSRIACIGIRELLSVLYAIATNSVPSTSSNWSALNAGRPLFSHRIFPSTGLIPYNPSFVLTIKYPREWTRCQFTALLNLADHAGAVLGWE